MYSGREIALETKHLYRAVPGKVLVNDISVAVRQGEILAVVGPSGAGKSSFLRLLNRLDEATNGTVLLDGKDYHEIAPRELRRRVGMVMQMAYLFPGTVASNIAFGPQQQHEPMSLEQIGGLLDRVGLPGYQDHDVNNLSGGEAQRVSLARTLANSPEVLLLDEPTSALDYASEREIEELVQSVVHERRLTCVIVTHDMSQAGRIADRTMHVEAGTLAQLDLRRRCLMPIGVMSSLSNGVGMSLAQAAAAIALCIAVVLVCRRFAVHVERETVTSLARGLMQMALVGVILALLLNSNLLVGVLILFAMMVAAALTASRRAHGIWGARSLSFYSIAAGSGIVIASMFAMGVLNAKIAMLVPVGSMIIANAMNACAQSIERFRSDVTSHVGQVETALALGADSAVSVAPYVQTAVYARLAPATRHAQVAGFRLDTRCNGRHGPVGYESAVCRYLPIHYRCHDSGCIRHYGHGCHTPCSQARVLTRSATRAPPGGTAPDGDGLGV